MTIEEIRSALRNKTIIQQEELFPKFIGMNITIEASIIDIEPTEIKFEYISNFERMESMENHCHVGFIRLKYNKERFGQELLSYKNGDDAKINATLLSITSSSHSNNFFDLELISILKYNSTRNDRINARYKKYNKSCFIATACYENIDAPEVVLLRQFRDSKLLISKTGRLLVFIYYKLSPPFAWLISKSERLKSYTRKYLLAPIIYEIQKIYSRKPQ